MSAIEGKAAVRKCNNSTTLDYRTSVVGVHTLLFAQVCSSNTDLHNSRLVDPGHSYVFENLVIDFALARTLDYDVLAAVEQRPKCGGLGVLCLIRAKSEVHSGIGQVSVARRIGDPELLDGRSFSDAFQDCIDCVARREPQNVRPTELRRPYADRPCPHNQQLVRPKRR